MEKNPQVFQLNLTLPLSSLSNNSSFRFSYEKDDEEPLLLRSRPSSNYNYNNYDYHYCGEIEAPYAWATTRRARVHSLEHLRSKGINIISGEVECKGGCSQIYRVEYNLEEKFKEMKDKISSAKNGSMMFDDRAPNDWMNPRLLNCGNCANPLTPVMPNKKRNTNWLFLLLGHMLGCCTLSQLNYFCWHTRNLNSRAKDKLLYLTYLGICKQLDPHDVTFDAELFIFDY